MKNIPFVKWLFVILSLVVGTVSGAMAQRYTPTDSAAFRAMQVGRVMQQERVFLHFDNSAYYLGETMWFKAYVSFGEDNRPSTLNKEPNMVLIEGMRGANSRMTVERPLIVYKEVGVYSDELLGEYGLK